MWTYLLIFLSLIAIVAVFVHRMLAMKKAEQTPATEEVPEEAEEVFEEGDVKKADKVRAQALCDRGQELLKKGNEEEAIKHFVQALSLDPNHSDTLHTLAMLYMQKEMFNPAIELFKQLAIMNEDAVHYSHLGFAHFRQNQLEEARVAYQKALGMDDSRPQRFVSLSQVYRSMQRPFHAIMALDKAMAHDPENRDYIFLMSDLKKEAGLLEESMLLLEMVLELEPDNMEAKILHEDIKKMLETDAGSNS